MNRKMGPLAADHPLVSSGECAACHLPFFRGEYVTLIPLGPGNDPEARRLRDEGKPYNAVATVVHWDCAEGAE